MKYLNTMTPIACVSSWQSQCVKCTLHVRFRWWNNDISFCTVCHGCGHVKRSQRLEQRKHHLAFVSPVQFQLFIFSLLVFVPFTFQTIQCITTFLCVILLVIFFPCAINLKLECYHLWNNAFRSKFIKRIWWYREIRLWLRNSIILC